MVSMQSSSEVLFTSMVTWYCASFCNQNGMVPVPVVVIVLHLLLVLLILLLALWGTAVLIVFVILVVDNVRETCYTSSLFVSYYY